jgi:hypothetical protein
MIVMGDMRSESIWMVMKPFQTETKDPMDHESIRKADSIAEAYKKYY